MEITTSYHRYPSIWNLGHRNIRDIFEDEVLIEEKIDGSQFSFGVFQGEIRCRSKGAQLNSEYPEKMFSLGVETVKQLDLKDGWTYRAEYLQKTKHNSLAYDRIPGGHLIIFDINTAEETYLDYDSKKKEADRIGLECVPLLFKGKVESVEKLLDLLNTVSILGGQKIEGFVVKNYFKFTEEKKAMMGKYVSEAFKEVHTKEWSKTNPGTGQIIENLIAKYRTPARWDKAIQHLKEAGKLDNSPKDIGLIIKEVGNDILKECEDEIKADLFEWAFSKMRRGCVAGIAEHYKEKLLRESV